MANAPATAAPVISVDLVRPFVIAVRDVLTKMAGVEPTIEKPHLKTKAGTMHEVCGIIGFTGQIVGSVVVSFSDTAAIKLVEAFAGEMLTTDHPDFADAIGELSNMIAGSAKAALGSTASISTPSVVIGKGYTVVGMSKTPCLVIPCKCLFGDFAIEVCIKQSAA